MENSKRYYDILLCGAKHGSIIEWALYKRSGIHFNANQMNQWKSMNLNAMVKRLNFIMCMKFSEKPLINSFYTSARSSSFLKTARDRFWKLPPRHCQLITQYLYCSGQNPLFQGWSKSVSGSRNKVWVKILITIWIEPNWITTR